MYKIWVQHKTQNEIFAYLGYSYEDPLKEKNLWGPVAEPRFLQRNYHKYG